MAVDVKDGGTPSGGGRSGHRKWWFGRRHRSPHCPNGSGTSHAPGSPLTLALRRLADFLLSWLRLLDYFNRMELQTFGQLGYPGRLIAVEGLDGSGKSTQIKLIKRWMELQGLKVFFSEWNSSVLVKSATSKGKNRELLTPTTFSLIHATDFADRYERQLVPLLRAGYLVLCDRYIFTAFARDTVRGCSPQWVRGIYDFAAQPDLVFFFRAPLETTLGRILRGRPTLKYFEAGMDLNLSNDIVESFRLFQGMQLEQYLAMSTEFNFLLIDAKGKVEEQQSMLRQLICQHIDLDAYRKEG